MGKGLDALIAQSNPKIVANARKKAEAILLDIHQSEVRPLAQKNAKNKPSKQAKNH